MVKGKSVSLLFCHTTYFYYCHIVLRFISCTTIKGQSINNFCCTSYF